MAGDSDFDVIVVGGGCAGAVSAATLALRGMRTLLIAETAKLGHNVRSVEIGGHQAIVQHPLWHFAYGGGNWTRIIREQNLPTRVHVPPHPTMTIRGSGRRSTVPVVCSAKATCDLLFDLFPMPVDDATKANVERVLHAGLSISPEELFLLHDLALNDWLDQQGADDVTKMVVRQLGASFSGLSPEHVGTKFSVFGTFVHIRVFISGEGLPAFIEPDAQRGFIEPLATRVEEFGGEVWRRTHVDRIVIQDGRARGVRMADGRSARADIVAIAVGNPRMKAIFPELPAELEGPLRKEAALVQSDLSIVTLLDRPVVDVTSYFMIADPATGQNMWFCPLHAMSPWNSPDDRQLCLIWGAAGEGYQVGEEKLEEYLDYVCEDEFPGWRDAIFAREHISHRHHWMNPCYTGPKVPRRSPSVEGLWYVGEGTAPVAGIGLEQASYAGYYGALEIAETLGKTALLRIPGL